MKSRILSLLVALAVVLSLAVPAFAQTGETSEDNDLFDVTDVADQEETDEDLPEETEEDEDDPAEPSGSEDNNNIPQNNIVNVVSGSAGGAEGNGQEEEPGSEDDDNVDEDNTKVGDNGNSEEDDSDEELNSEDGEFGENTSSEDGENETEEEDESGEDGESETDGNESEEDDEAEEDNVSEDDENDSEEDAESEDGESGNDKDNSEEDAFAEDEPEEDDKPEEGEDEPVEDANEPEEENESEESEDNSADDESTEDADIVDGFRLLTAEELEGIDLEDAEVLQVNSVVFMAAGAVKTEPLMAAAKSAPVQSGTCGDNLTWELDDEGVLTISGTGAMDDYLLQYGVGITPWSRAGQITKLILNDGITSIGGGAFYNLYEAVSEVTIPRSVVSIGKSAFSGANGITTIRFEHTANDPLTIGQYAFYYYYGHTYDMTDHPTLSTTIIVPDKNNINPAISGYSWTEDVRTVTFKSASDSGSSTTNNNVITQNSNFFDESTTEVTKEEYLEELRNAYTMGIDPMDATQTRFPRLLRSYLSAKGVSENDISNIISVLEQADPVYRDIYLLSLIEEYEFNSVNDGESSFQLSNHTLNVPLNGSNSFIDIFFHESGHAAQEATGDKNVINMWLDDLVRQTMPLADDIIGIADCLKYDVDRKIRDYLLELAVCNDLTTYLFNDLESIRIQLRHVSNTQGADSIKDQIWNYLYDQMYILNLLSIDDNGVAELYSKVSYDIKHFNSLDDWKSSADDSIVRLESIISEKLGINNPLFDNTDLTDYELRKSIIEEFTDNHKYQAAGGYSNDVYVNGYAVSPTMAGCYQIVRWKLSKEIYETTIVGNNNPQSNMVSDVYGGITNMKIRGSYGHEAEEQLIHYWYSQYDAITYNQVYEAWAEFFDAKIRGDQDNIELNREYFKTATDRLEQYAIDLRNFYLERNNMPIQ